ncbi:ryncolin-1-like [Xenia sp. Carnegie-2017]|uniref:ryncolin-1-like n=1 Tax=Xenia sp. Carnegie-2017 TaxID=2897299 RepID=UPI001F03D994|nr:ryncolin-1-like [Xenia sp. Carnegie-2017]
MEYIKETCITICSAITSICTGNEFLEKMYLTGLLLVCIILVIPRSTHGICCDEIEKTVKSKINAHKILCKTGRIVSLNCCNEIKKKIKSFEDAYESLCLDENEAKTCADHYKTGHNQSGIYTINPDGQGSFSVFCDMTTPGGGWTVFQRRIDGSVNFYRGWQDYKNGFGNLSSEFWLGLDKIHRLTNVTNNKLRINLEDTSGNKRYAEYDHFSVKNEKQKYELKIGKYSGTAKDSLGLHNGMKFTTKDSDNDKSSGNCAASYKGAWWYENCHHSNLNGLYKLGKHSSYADGVNWFHWKGYYYSLKSTTMEIGLV